MEKEIARQGFWKCRQYTATLNHTAFTKESVILKLTKQKMGKWSFKENQYLCPSKSYSMFDASGCM